MKQGKMGADQANQFSNFGSFRNMLTGKTTSK
jgi:hypothetical protein